MPEANPVALNDQGTTLNVDDGTGVYKELVGIVSVPDQGAAGNNIEVTELKSPIKQYVSDRVDTPSQDFTYNRTQANFEAVQKVCDGNVHNFAIKFSDGTATKIVGTAQTWKNGFQRGSAQEATLHIVATNIEYGVANEIAPSQA